MKLRESGTRTDNSIRNLLMGIGSQLLLSMAAFICRMVFVRCLSQEYLGLNGLFTNLLSMLCLAELGIGTAIIYELYGALAKKDEERIKTLMRFYRRLYNAVGCFVILGGLVLIPFIPRLTGGTSLEENIYLIYIIYLLDTGGSYFFSYRSALITADQKNYIVTGIRSAVIVIQDIAQITILLTTRNYILYIVCQLMFTVINNVIVYAVSSKLYPFLKEKRVRPMDRVLKKRMITNAKATVISKVSYTLVNSTDHIIISALCGLASTGVVSNYTLIIQTMQSFIRRVFEALTASIGNLNATKQDEYREQVFHEINFMIFWLYSWSALLFLILSGFAVKLFFGETYVVAQMIVIILAVNYYTDGMHALITTYRNTLGIFKEGQYMNLITGILNILFSVLLGRIYGVFGILLATLLSRAVSVFWYYPYTVFRHGFGVSVMRYYRKYGLYFAAFAGAYGILYLLQSVVNVNEWVDFGFDLLTAAVIPPVVYSLIFGKTKEFRALKGRVLMKWKR